MAKIYRPDQVVPNLELAAATNGVSGYQRNKRKLGIKSTAKAFIKALFWPVLLVKACLRSVETFIAKYN